MEGYDGDVGRERKSLRKSTRSSPKETAAAAGQHSSSRRAIDRSGRPSVAVADRSTGPIDQRAQHARGVAVDRSGRPQKESGRPHGRPARSTSAYGRSTDRSTDSGSGCLLN